MLWNAQAFKRNIQLQFVVVCLPPKEAHVAFYLNQDVMRRDCYLPGSPFPRPQTRGSRPRLYPHTQAAARRWGSGSGVTPSPGCQVLSQSCSSYPVGLLHIHLASSTCQPFLVKSCKTPASKTHVTKDNTSSLRLLVFSLFFFFFSVRGLVLLQRPTVVTANLFPYSMHGCPLQMSRTGR